MPSAMPSAWPGDPPDASALGGKTVVCKTAPVASSTIRSQETRTRSPSGINSAASICQVWCGWPARPETRGGRCGGGAGPSPAPRNHRCRVRGSGQASSGRRRLRATRIRTAPQVGCWRRRVRASWRDSVG
jgi:hypothetical protein